MVHLIARLHWTIFALSNLNIKKQKGKGKGKVEEEEEAEEKAARIRRSQMARNQRDAGLGRRRRIWKRIRCRRKERVARTRNQARSARPRAKRLKIPRSQRKEGGGTGIRWEGETKAR